MQHTPHFASITDELKRHLGSRNENNVPNNDNNIIGKSLYPSASILNVYKIKVHLLYRRICIIILHYNCVDWIA